MLFPVGYVVYFGFYFSRFVAIVFLGIFGFLNFFNFLSFWVFKFAGFPERSFLFTIMTCWFSGWAFVVRIAVWCIAISTFLFFWSFFSVLFSIFLYVLFFSIGFPEISFSRFVFRASGMVFFLFFLSYVLCCTCSSTFSISKSFFKQPDPCFSVGDWCYSFCICNSVLNSGKSCFF